MDLKGRLISFIEYKKLDKATFQRICGLGNGFVDKSGDNTRLSSLEKISNVFPELNLTWLRIGIGEMLKEKGSNPTSTVDNDTTSTYNEAKQINLDVTFVPLVSQYAYAGYTHGYADAEYVDTLPVVPYFVDRELKGKYVCFEVKGDSMTDGSSDSILEGDRLMCREIKKEYWKYKLHINKWAFVIVHKTEGVLIKEIIDHNVDTGELTLHSRNIMYDDFVINLNDVKLLFNVIDITRSAKK